ncbi:MAG: CCA tRNA nucleotidyltransferase [Ardenticatenaceae bacterium]|nr:CCA tRNA nucleotidyltransferase [Anaerolineales bacterium]MCB8920698.1 CCA tRNA nucleotidyltransferase [Ardenticatenaceae bacterium]MCB8989658.1 CCA tRNA nucleotidyltransferase [Ardenticatenaceae bacterium]MCB9002884.1 CCA tRNA nucleotidyltransferase [Ardenticatenaceae bacterium]
MFDLTPYAGRWVALVGEHVAGVGYTPEEAVLLARRNRPKERLAVRFVEPPGGEPLSLPPLMDELRPFLQTHEDPVYLVGGAVRDAVLGRSGKDLDFVVPRQAIKLAFKVGDALGLPAYPLDKERDTGRVVLPEGGVTLDFARFRGADLNEDLRDRDFTINTLALPATAETTASIIDICGGLADLQARQIRLTHDDALRNDPVRTLRAVRQALSLGFSLPPETATAVTTAAPLLVNTSRERIRDELVKLLETAVPHEALRYLHELGLLPVTLPDVAALADVAQSPPHHEAVLAHTMSVLRWLVVVETAVLTPAAPASPALQLAQEAFAPYRAELNAHVDRVVDGGGNGRLLLRLGALFHDVGKQETQTVGEDGRYRFFGHDKVGAKRAKVQLRRLAFSNQAQEHVAAIVRGHMRPLLLVEAQGAAPSRRAVYRFFRDIKSAGLDVGLLALADHLATYEGPGPAEKWANLVAMVAGLYRFYFERYEETVAPVPLVNGRDLIQALDLVPGPEIGRLLRLIEEAQASGQLTTREEALTFAQERVSGI